MNPRLPLMISFRHEDGMIHARAMHDALAEHGVPCWIDEDQMAHGNMDAQLRHVIEHETSGAILVATPALIHSTTVSDVEFPAIKARFKKDAPGYFIAYSLANGIDRTKLSEVLRCTPDDDALHGHFTPSIDGTTGAHKQAGRVLRRWLSRYPDQALNATLHAFDTTIRDDTNHLQINMSHHFQGKVASPLAWRDHILPAVRQLKAELVRTKKPVTFRGQAPHSLVFLVARALHVSTTVNAAWQPHDLQESIAMRGHQSASEHEVTVQDGSGEGGVIIMEGQAKIAAAAIKAAGTYKWAITISPPPGWATATTNDVRNYARQVHLAILEQNSLAPADDLRIFASTPVSIAWATGQLSNAWPMPRFMQHIDGTPNYGPTVAFEVA